MTFAVRTEKGTIRLGDEPGRAAFQITHLIGGIGEKALFIILFKWPENVSKFEYAEPDQNFLQVTGTQNGLTVELMQDGRLFTVGHPGGETQPAELERRDGPAMEVNQNEILTTDEAIGLFTGYLETESLDTSAWSLREIPLDSEQQVSDPGSSSASISDEEAPTQAPPAKPQSQPTGQGDGTAHETPGPRDAGEGKLYL